MNLPNRLTIARIIMVPAFALFAALGFKTGERLYYFLAGILFAAASLTDMLDGKIARAQNLVTNFGKFADPLADKILTTAAFIYMVRENVCAPMALTLILFREFAVSGLRMLAAGAENARVIPANIWGKLKTVTMMGSILLFYFGCALFPGLSILRPAVKILCWVCAAVTVISGLTYFSGSGDLFSDMK